MTRKEVRKIFMSEFLQHTTATVAWSFFSNLMLALLKLAGGWFGHSNALLADGMESATDAISSFFLYVAMRYAAQKPNSRYPYGYGKVETLMTMISVGLIFSCGLTILVHSLYDLLLLHESPHAYTLYILCAVIVWKEISYQYVKRKAHQTQSQALLTEAWHHRSDALTSLCALFGVAIAVFFGPGYESADDIAAIFAAILIFYNAYHLFHPVWNELIDSNIYEDIENQVREVAMKIDGVRRTEKCYVRKSGMYYHVELHIQVLPDVRVDDGHQIAHDVKNEILKEIPLVQTVSTHLEPVPKDFMG